MFFQFIVYLWNFLMNFCLFLSNSTAGPRIHQLPPSLPNQPTKSLLSFLPLGYDSFSIRHSALIKYESHHTITLLKIPPGLLLEHLNLNHIPCLLLWTNLLLFCLENNFLWGSLNKLNLIVSMAFVLNIPSDWNVLPHILQDLFLPQLAISMHVMREAAPSHQGQNSTHTSTHTPSFHFSSDYLCYLYFST